MVETQKDAAIREIRELADRLYSRDIRTLPAILRLVALAADWNLDRRLSGKLIQLMRELTKERKGRL